MAYWRELRQDKDQIVDVRREEVRNEGPVARAITWIGKILSSPFFFLALLLLHAAWFALNIPGLSPLTPWDPPPFTLLATIASVEAPFLALLILMRQQQDRRVAELREDTELQTSLHTERETTKLLRMLSRVHEELGIQEEQDPELESMMKPLDPDRLVEQLEGRMEEDEEEPGRE